MTKSNILLVTLWIVSTIGMMMYFSAGKQVEFDPQGKLHFAAMQDDFDQKVIHHFQRYSDTLRNQVFHLKRANCRCNTLNQLHTQRLDNLLEKHQFQSHHLSLNSANDDALLSISTPAIVVFDNQGQLAYLGPYSVGLLCGIGNAFVDQYIKNVIQDTHLGASIISDAKGCYCASSSAAKSSTQSII